MQANALMASSTRPSKNLNRATRATQSPELGGAAVRQHRPRPTGKDGRHPPSPQTDSPMAEGEHAVKYGYQESPFAAALNSPQPHSNLQQLAMGHYPVLPLGELANRPRGVTISHLLTPKSSSPFRSLEAWSLANCINFSILKIEKLMQFGRGEPEAGHEPDSGGRRRAGGARKVTLRRRKGYRSVTAVRSDGSGGEERTAPRWVSRRCPRPWPRRARGGGPEPGA